MNVVIFQDYSSTLSASNRLDRFEGSCDWTFDAACSPGVADPRRGPRGAHDGALGDPGGPQQEGGDPRLAPHGLQHPAQRR